MQVESKIGQVPQPPIELSQWSRIASNYDWSGFELKNVMPPLLRSLKGLADKKIVEFGCGIGVVALQLAKSARKILAIDSSEKMLSCAKENCVDYANIRFLNARFDRPLDFDEKYDAAIFAFTLEQQPTVTDIIESFKNAKKAVDWTSKHSSIIVLLPHPCFDFAQSGDITRTMHGQYMERPIIEIKLTPKHGRSVEFFQPHWCLEDYFIAAEEAKLRIYQIQEVGNNRSSSSTALEPRYMIFKCEPISL